MAYFVFFYVNCCSFLAAFVIRQEVLVKLYLGGCQLSKEAVTSLCIAMHHNRSIQVLDLSENGLDYSSAAALSALIRTDKVNIVSEN
jgi:hypothetical protein